MVFAVAILFATKLCAWSGYFKNLLVLQPLLAGIDWSWHAEFELRLQEIGARSCMIYTNIRIGMKSRHQTESSRFRTRDLRYIGKVMHCG